jgi:hypothetical protein
LNNPEKSQTLLDAHLRQIGVGLTLLGVLLGFLVGFGTLSGDEQGRVNLLFLLLIFAFLPVMTLVLSLVFLLRRNGRGLAGWLLELPLWPRHLSAALLELDVRQCRKDWLVHQGQGAGTQLFFWHAVCIPAFAAGDRHQFCLAQHYSGGGGLAADFAA